MSTPFKIYWTDAAVADLAQLADFIAARDSIERAHEVCDRLEDAASSLASSPNRGRIVPELQEQGIVVYSELLVKPWRIVYRAENRSAFILAIIDSRRDAVDLLWERLTR
jgi:plasmid stabilization system protein ParE